MTNAKFHQARSRMKSVMIVWTGVKTINEVAAFRKTTVREIERWCKAAMRGAKAELSRLI